MPAPYRLTPRALDDLDDIWNFIAEDSLDAANRVESAIFPACESLSRRPMLGSKRVENHFLAGSFLARNPLSQLHRRLSARHQASAGSRRTPWKEKHAGSA